MRITHSASLTTEGLVFDEAEANARGIFIETDDAEHEHPLVRAARVGRLEFAEIEATPLRT